MTDFVALPLIVLVAAAVFGSPRLDRLPPPMAARGNAILLVAVTAAAVPTLWLIGLSGLAHLGFHNPVVDWSRHLLPDLRPLGAVVGVASLGLAIVGTSRAWRVLVLHRRLRCTDTGQVEEIDTDEVYAYTLPGPAGTIAVSRGLRESLTSAEYDIVLAHERSHALNRHDRYLLLALLASAFVPALRSVAKRQEFFLERWADESAVDSTGADRREAARTIAKVALAGSAPRSALAIAGYGVADRAAALLEPIGVPVRAERITTTTVMVATVALAASQIHHTAMFASHLLR